MEDDDETPERFSLSAGELEQLSDLADTLRGQLRLADPAFIRDAAVALLALARLPEVTEGAMVTIGWVHNYGGGNREWADLKISEEEITASVGAHFYDPDVGGDTEINTLFEAFIGGGRRGDLESWFEHAQYVAAHGRQTVDAEGTDFNALPI